MSQHRRTRLRIKSAGTAQIFDYLVSGPGCSAAHGAWEPMAMIPITNRRRRGFNVIAFSLGDSSLTVRPRHFGPRIRLCFTKS